MRKIKIISITALIAIITFAGCSNMLTENPNRPPSSVLDENNFTLYPGVEQPLDLSRSVDVDTQALTYKWEVIDEPSVDAASLVVDAADPAKAVFSAEIPGEYYLLAAVLDEYEVQDSTFVFVTVEHDAPTASAGAGASRYPGVPFTLSGSALDDDPDGTASLTYSWEVLSKPAVDSEYTLTGGNTLTPTFVTAFYADGATDYSTVPSYLGDYTLRLSVTDEWGLTDESDVVVTVENDNPTANLVVPGLSSGVLANLTGTTSNDPDSLGRQTAGDLRYVWSVTDSPVGSQWSWDGDPPGTVGTFETGNTDNVDWEQDSPGVYTLRLTVYDEFGGSDTSDRIVAAAANTAPVIAAPADIVSTSDTLVGAGSAADSFSDDDTDISNDGSDTFSLDPTVGVAFVNTENDTLVYSWMFDDFAVSVDLIVDGATRTLTPGQVITTDHLSPTLTVAPTDLGAFPDNTWDFTITLTASDGIETSNSTGKIYFDLF